MFKIILTSFYIEKKLKKAYFFEKTFLLANFSIEMVLKIIFFTFNNTNVLFIE